MELPTVSIIMGTGSILAAVALYQLVFGANDKSAV